MTVSITPATETRVFTHYDYRAKAFLFFLSLIVFFSACFKIVDLGFWWHLKTGQIILQQRAFQYQEIYSFTAKGREYIDHEWLFQLGQYLLYSFTGSAGVVVFKALVINFIYFITSAFLLRNGASVPLTLGVVLLSVLGGRTRFIERPEVFTTLFMVLVYVIVDSFLKKGKGKLLFALPPLILVWANLHAAVILGLLIQLSFLVGCVVERFAKRSGYPNYYDSSGDRLAQLSAVIVVCTLVAGMNPTGFRVLLVPFELTAIIDSGLLNNQEWQQPLLRYFPFYYVSLLAAFAVLVWNFRRLHFANFLQAAFFAYISLKYVRNVGLFCMLMPLWIAPYAGSLSEKCRRLRGWLVVANTGLAAVLIYTVFHSYPYEFGLGIASYFPEKIVQFTKDNNPQGHMINSYAFGGYLIWRMYPEREVFIDGRNEVYLPLLKKIVASRGDSRKWTRLLEEYGIEYALLNYVDDLEELTLVNEEGQRIVTFAPFSSTHFPRSRWALIYWDDNGMILIRRHGANRNFASLEYASIFPEGRFYQESLVRAGKVNRALAVAELQRKLKEDPYCRRAKYLLSAIQESK